MLHKRSVSLSTRFCATKPMVAAQEPSNRQGQLAKMPQHMESPVATNDPLQENVLRQYYNDDWSVRPDIHPFMSEIAHLAVHRGIKQEGLAKLYNRAVGTRLSGANISRHFDLEPGRLKPITHKVIAGYTTAFDLSRMYVRLLLALSRSKPPLLPARNDSRIDLRQFIDRHLQPGLIGPLLQADGLSNALKLLLNDESLAIECVNAAELAWQRHMVFKFEVNSDLAPKIVTLREAGSGQGFEEWEWDASGHGDPWYRTGIRE